MPLRFLNKHSFIFGVTALAILKLANLYFFIEDKLSTLLSFYPCEHIKCWRKGVFWKPTYKKFTQLTRNSCLVASESEWCWKTQAIAECAVFQHSPSDYLLKNLQCIMGSNWCIMGLCEEVVVLSYLLENLLSHPKSFINRL